MTLEEEPRPTDAVKAMAETLCQGAEPGTHGPPLGYYEPWCGKHLNEARDMAFVQGHVERVIDAKGSELSLSGVRLAEVEAALRALVQPGNNIDVRHHTCTCCGAYLGTGDAHNDGCPWVAARELLDVAPPAAHVLADEGTPEAVMVRTVRDLIEAGDAIRCYPSGAVGFDEWSDAMAQAELVLGVFLDEEGRWHPMEEPLR